MIASKTLFLFSLTALAEIVGCYCVYAWLRLNSSIFLLIPAILSLAVFAWLLTLHPSHAGRVYAAYGGVYVAMSIVWLWLFEKQTPDIYDLSGLVITLIGMSIIAFGPHKV
jgi:small multidrug resistance family-3 protein